MSNEPLVRIRVNVAAVIQQREMVLVAGTLSPTETNGVRRQSAIGERRSAVTKRWNPSLCSRGSVTSASDRSDRHETDIESARVRRIFKRAALSAQRLGAA
jgi:hypothetical protein